jgi:DNA-directed RNA polymerase specialized sigma24 family protein
MSGDDFDLDVVDADQAQNEQLVASLDAAALVAAISHLPHDLQSAATGVLAQGRTYSDVSQELGIRQPELVRALHRSRALIAHQLANAAAPSDPTGDSA